MSEGEGVMLNNEKINNMDSLTYPESIFIYWRC